MDQILVEAQKLFDYTQGLRRDFHRFPEIGFQERRTAGIVARELAALGLDTPHRHRRDRRRRYDRGETAGQSCAAAF